MWALPWSILCYYTRSYLQGMRRTSVSMSIVQNTKQMLTLRLLVTCMVLKPLDPILKLQMHDNDESFSSLFLSWDTEYETKILIRYTVHPILVQPLHPCPNQFDPCLLNKSSSICSTLCRKYRYTFVLCFTLSSNTWNLKRQLH